MASSRDTNRHFRVVRFHPDFGTGLIKDIIADNLTIEEAELIAKQNLNHIALEDIVIQDQNRVGLEAEIQLDDGAHY